MRLLSATEKLIQEALAKRDFPEGHYHLAQGFLKRQPPSIDEATAELSKAMRGVPERDLAVPFSEPSPIIAHGLLRRLAPLMLMLYRRRDAREIA